MKPKRRSGASAKPVPGNVGDDILMLENQLCFALYAASRLIIQSYSPLLDAIGLTYPQYLVLLVLWERDGLTVTEIGRSLYLDSGTLTPILARLKDAHLIVRKRQDGDQRLVHNYLSDKGRELKSTAAEVPAALLCQSGASIDEIVALRETVKAFVQTVRKPRPVGPAAAAPKSTTPKNNAP